MRAQIIRLFTGTAIASCFVVLTAGATAAKATELTVNKPSSLKIQFAAVKYRRRPYDKDQKNSHSGPDHTIRAIEGGGGIAGESKSKGKINSR